MKPRAGPSKPQAKGPPGKAKAATKNRMSAPTPKGLRAFRLPAPSKAAPTPAPAALAARRLAAARAFAAQAQEEAEVAVPARGRTAPASPEPDMPLAPRGAKHQLRAVDEDDREGLGIEIRPAQPGTLAVPTEGVGDFEVKKARAAPVLSPEELAAITKGKVPAPEPAARGKGKARTAEDDEADRDAAHEPQFAVKGGAASKIEPAGDGLQVVSKTASKFSAEDMEMLKRLIVPKGQSVIDGFNLDTVKFNEEGLVPVLTQDQATGAILGQVWANREALEKTLREKTLTTYNRKTQRVAPHGEESGRLQALVRLLPDCDNDAVLALVQANGPACHRDTATCWTDGRTLPIATSLGELDRAIGEAAKTAQSEVAVLLADPVEAMKRVVEQTKDVVGSLRGQGTKELDDAAADLLYHLLVACRAKGVTLEPILKATAKRLA